MKKVTINDIDYSLKMSVMASIELEEELGDNPVNVLLNELQTAEENKLPKIKTLARIFYYCIKSKQSDIKYSEAVELMGNYLEENDIKALIILIISVFQDSGLLPKGDEDSKNFLMG